jgi:hypothetical protein
MALTRLALIAGLMALCGCAQTYGSHSTAHVETSVTANPTVTLPEGARSK